MIHIFMRRTPVDYGDKKMQGMTTIRSAGPRPLDKLVTMLFSIFTLRSLWYAWELCIYLPYYSFDIRPCTR